MQLEKSLKLHCLGFVDNSEFYHIFVFCIISIILAIVLVAASLIVAPQPSDGEKLSAYECGFDPFDDSRNQFDVRFYLVAILFIIFDLEIAFLFPFIVNLSTQSVLSLGAVFLFLTILTIGFVYEWKKDALEWE
uniref:NADH dehydrogenase subunit 3 n=1 Tax=Ancyromonas sigmoides TaxID=85707 RepID=UPI0028D73D0D|nr:NADH dehydrogenase subunit 3 [Ancyromonas sigmoides]WMQ52540.1 NADH dehydrogenase subunit 3 [Ancyromonas sigmoides]